MRVRRQANSHRPGISPPLDVPTAASHFQEMAQANRLTVQRIAQQHSVRAGPDAFIAGRVNT